MKVIIPLAGKGTRLRPHTLTVPKPMLRVAGKPVMDYVLDDVRKLGDVDEVIYITGHLKEAVELHAKSAYPDMKASFIEQTVQDGTAGAVGLARSRVDQPVLIIFVDTIFDADLSVIKTSTDDGILWTKVVDDWQRYGVIVADENGHMTKIVEKPTTPISKRANIGLQYIKNWKLLFEGIDHVMAQPKNKGEWYLTDAFQYMVEHGAKLKVAEAAGWYDAGQVDTIIATNGVMLGKGRAQVSGAHPDCTIVQPVYIEENVTLTGSTIGPNVSISSGTSILNSSVRDSIIGKDVKIDGCVLGASLVGDHAVISRVKGTVSMGEYSEAKGTE
ncbi:MAG TPA: sugar phosphate nucleotidyltransferase [Gemmatimonadaceae bacterium]|jgi:glucose-1-phosphate thymidylyltransferase|nr:sugar phosphate nucleotidyltransferase [Gemmatimonadaceae bacterium]